MSAQTHGDPPSWVQADPACRHAWQHDSAWRKLARVCLPAVGRPAGDGGTVGDDLLWKARRAYAAQQREQARAGPSGPGCAQAHAPACPCARCRRERGERPLPTATQQRQRRRGDHAVVPADMEHRAQERISLDRRVSWVRLADALRDGHGKITTCDVRPEFLGYLDGLLRKGLLEQLWQSHPHLARAFTGCAVERRTQEDLAREEGVTHQAISYRVKRARALLRQAATS